ncbi:MAG TPA: sulfotransferase [Rhizomicrobium sp.]|nr:sulfotransferase [Rhizomicrobium sp.]
MQVIGAGFGRTGTFSLKVALEMLGYAPCYHMVEVFAHPEHNDTWEAAIAGEPVDWKAFLGGYPAGVDWPIGSFWRSLAGAFPDAKFILTERDPEAWYKSMSQTILAAMNRPGEPPDEVRRRQVRMGRKLMEMVFAGDAGKDNVIAVYKRHNADVKAGLPASRLLVTDSPDGWGPICRFLGKPVPSVPFPKTNTTDEFRARANL